MHHTDPKKQVEEVLVQFQLIKECNPFTRCLVCDGLLKNVNKTEISEDIPELTQKYYQTFIQCQSCKKVYWKGPHYIKLKNWVEKILRNEPE
ncbi:Mut7-C RNAse domain-containing protein [Legionella sp. WA2022007384]